MNQREWVQTALLAARRALFEYQVANQAMYDARRALECAQEPARASEVDALVAEAGTIPGRLQGLVNALGNDPILDSPKDTDSAGEPERHVEDDR